MKTRKFLKPACWFLLVWFFLASRTSAQVHSFSLDYSEIITSDYSGLLNAGQSGTVRIDSLVHKGQFSFEYLSDSSCLLSIHTNQFYTSFRDVVLPGEIQLLVYLNKQRRPYKVGIADSLRSTVPLFQGWLAELHLRLPSEGRTLEEKQDGDFNTTYRVLPMPAGGAELVKSRPVYVRKKENRQAVGISDFHWKQSFDKGGIPVSVQVNERKQQVMGRKMLACVNRWLIISRKSTLKKGRERKSFFGDHVAIIELAPRLQEQERRERMAASLLRGESIEGLISLLHTSASMSGEQHFRLKSVFRSLLVLDSSAYKPIVELLKREKQGSVNHDILETAIIESGTMQGEQYILQELGKRKNKYEDLKDLLIRISVADAVTPTIATMLAGMLEASADDDTKSMLSLTLSNYALTIRESLPHLFNNLTGKFMFPYVDRVSDTLQYLYLAGNAGITSEAERLMQMAVENPARKADIIFALRNIHSPLADSMVFDYLASEDGRSIAIGQLLSGRNVNKEWVENRMVEIVEADKLGDSSRITLVQYLLDNAWLEPFDIRPLIDHHFSMAIYRNELEDFKRQSSLCGQWPKSVD